MKFEPFIDVKELSKLNKSSSPSIQPGQAQILHFVGTALAITGVTEGSGEMVMGVMGNLTVGKGAHLQHGRDLSSRRGFDEAQ